MKILVNILSFVLIVFSIGFADVSLLNRDHGTNGSSVQMNCETDTVSTELKPKLRWGLRDLTKNQYWYLDDTSYTGDKKRMDWLMQQIIDGNFYTHKIDSCSLSTLKESLNRQN